MLPPRNLKGSPCLQTIQLFQIHILVEKQPKHSNICHSALEDEASSITFIEKRVKI